MYGGGQPLARGGVQILGKSGPRAWCPLWRSSAELFAGGGGGGEVGILSRVYLVSFGFRMMFGMLGPSMANQFQPMRVVSVLFSLFISLLVGAITCAWVIERISWRDYCVEVLDDDGLGDDDDYSLSRTPALSERLSNGAGLGDDGFAEFGRASAR